MEFSDFGKIDLCIHNVAVEQISFFKVTFKVEELLDPGIFKGKQYHNAYEFVGLKKGKMSSRKGNVVLGNEILNEAYEKVLKVVKGKKIAENSTETAEIIGVGAVKYSFLKISPFKYLAFDLEESLNFEGDSGPYIQYTYTRTQSILKKANQNSEYDFNPETLVEKEETEVLKWLERFDEVVSLATRDYSPNFIAAYLFELTQKFNRFYKSVTVLNAEESEKNSRLALVEVVGETIKKGLDLLGIKAPEKM
jgi:arginyl-tRNA synthetase